MFLGVLLDGLSLLVRCIHPARRTVCECIRELPPFCQVLVSTRAARAKCGYFKTFGLPRRSRLSPAITQLHSLPTLPSHNLQAVATIRKVVNEIIERVQAFEDEQRLEDVRRRLWAGKLKDHHVPEIRKPGRKYATTRVRSFFAKCITRDVRLRKPALRSKLCAWQQRGCSTHHSAKPCPGTFCSLSPQRKPLFPSVQHRVLLEVDVEKQSHKDPAVWAKRRMFLFNDILLYLSLIHI